jgi:hypothetical protein
MHAQSEYSALCLSWRTRLFLNIKLVRIFSTHKEFILHY